MKKYIAYLFIFISFILGQQVYAESSDVSGFIPGQIWYSEDELTEGDTVDIHTAVWNGEDYSIKVKVEFYDNDTVLGTRNVALSSNELKDVSISWKVTAGDHVILAKITSSSFGSNSESLILKRTTTSKSRESIDSTITDENGEATSISDTLSTQVKEIIPGKIISSTTEGFNNLENIRSENSEKIDTAKEEAQEELNTIKSSDTAEESSFNKFLANIKVFALSALSFIFNNKVVFYGVLLLLAFGVIRFIYRKIRHR